MHYNIEVIKINSKIEIIVETDFKKQKDEYKEDITKWIEDLFHRSVQTYFQQAMESDSFENDIIEIMANEDIYLPDKIREFSDLGGITIHLK